MASRLCWEKLLWFSCALMMCSPCMMNESSRRSVLVKCLTAFAAFCVLERIVQSGSRLEVSSISSPDDCCGLFWLKPLWWSETECSTLPFLLWLKTNIDETEREKEKDRERLLSNYTLKVIKSTSQISTRATIMPAVSFHHTATSVYTLFVEYNYQIHFFLLISHPCLPGSGVIARQVLIQKSHSQKNAARYATSEKSWKWKWRATVCSCDLNEYFKKICFALIWW